MTGDEARQCMYSKQPVWHDGIRYEKIRSIVYTLDDRDNLIVSAILVDTNRNSSMQARIKDIKLQEEKE